MRQLATIAAAHEHIDGALSGLFDPSEPLAFLDCAACCSVGANASYVGQANWLSNNGGAPSYIASIDRFDWLAMEERIGTGPIILQGGDCFGDQCSRSQHFREAVLWRYRESPIIQLPQTVQFTSQAAIDQAARVIDRHGKFTLLVRDQKSLDLARRFFNCDTRLSPDMAFALGQLPRGNPSKSLIMLLDGDADALEFAANVAKFAIHSAVVSDWPEQPVTWGHVNHRRLKRIGNPFRRRADDTAAIWLSRAQTGLNLGLELLRQGEFVITDRLQGHILCVLLGIPHCAVGNSDSELGKYIDTWHSDAHRVWRAGSVQEAVTLYRSLLG